MLDSKNNGLSLTLPEKISRKGRCEPEFYNDLTASLSEAWRLLECGAADRRSPFHTPTLATTRNDGSPSLRTLVLRSAEPSEWTLRFHTDLRSSKFRELSVDPRVAVHFYDASRKIQLRIDGHAELLTSEATIAAIWESMKSFSRACYQVETTPGSVIDDPRAGGVHANTIQANPGLENFALVHVEIYRLEWLYLAAKGHRRARFERLNGQLSATWIAP